MIIMKVALVKVVVVVAAAASVAVIVTRRGRGGGGGVGGGEGRQTNVEKGRFLPSRVYLSSCRSACVPLSQFLFVCFVLFLAQSVYSFV